MTIKWRLGRVYDQKTHEAINASNYPGTRQLCVLCDSPTGRCEEDAIYLNRSDRGSDSSVSLEDIGPLCEDCLDRELESERLVADEMTI